MKLYKVLRDGKSCNGGQLTWSLPIKREDGTWQPGDWMPEIEGDLEACKNGYHLCSAVQLINWLDEGIYEAEYDGDIIEADDKYVVRKCRLVSRVETWNDRTARLFACWCAEQVLPIYEKQRPNDDRPRKAIETARRFADGQATADELDAARAVAWSAAWDTEKAAERAAAWNAWDAAWDAARAAAWSAARASEGCAAWASASCAAWASASSTQSKQLIEMLGIDEVKL